MPARRAAKTLTETPTETPSGSIRVGIGGWTYEPWRGVFFPTGLAHRRELEHASRQVTAIEVNGTYYGSQKPESFRRWHDETPDDFVFAVKGPRFTTNRRVLAEAGTSIARFFASGVTELKGKLGPVNWQFLPTKAFVAEDVEAFLSLLPKTVDGLEIRHVIEARHESFRSPDFVTLLRRHGVAAVLADSDSFPLIPDPTAPFVYMRLQRSTEAEELGYGDGALDLWAARARAYAAGRTPEGLDFVGAASEGGAGPRDVFVFFISGFKERNPAAAAALIKRLAG